jgi:hypothetical protein
MDGSEAPEIVSQSAAKNLITAGMDASLPSFSLLCWDERSA